MATKPTKARRAAPRKRRKPPASGKPKRHPWTREDGEIHGPGYKIGYARVSTLDQNQALQQDALKEAGCEKIFIEQMSGAVTDRPALREVLDYARSGDTLIVWKLDRLARSMKQLSRRSRSCACAISAFGASRRRSTRRRRKASWCFTCSARLRSSSALSFGSAPAPDSPQRSARAEQEADRRS
jgi:hypothetical protein